MKSIRTVADVAAWRLCLGCGACEYICPERFVRMADVPDQGRRPVLSSTDCGSCRACLEVCPAVENDHRALAKVPGVNRELLPLCGPVLELWEGYALDPEIRFQGSSGGALTALSLFCLEQQAMSGVLHIGGDPDQPLRNVTGLSRSREELLARTGSRYAPASVCDRLDLVEQASAPCVIVGQPAEISALRKAQTLRPALNDRVGIALSFFCAGAPSADGTEALLRKLGIDPSRVADVRYRGRGWPGHFEVLLQGESKPAARLTYRESWSFLQKFRPYAVHLNPDTTGEEADISCGDPWYREPREGEPGSSLIVVRTERGRQLLRAAAESGYLALARSTPERLRLSQKNLFDNRGQIWGRRLAWRCFGLPATRLSGFHLFRAWLGAPLGRKLRSVFGTARRIWQRGYTRPLPPPRMKSAVHSHANIA